MVLYCEICSLPVEFCEFGKSFKKCKLWLQSNNNEIYNKLYNSDIKSSLSKEEEEKISNSLAKMQLKEERKMERDLINLQNSKILIKRIPRTKHKYIVAIANLDLLDPNLFDMKKTCKKFASKFATGCSISKNSEKKDEIVIQGDVADEVESYLREFIDSNGINIKIEHVTERFTNKKK